MGGVAHSRSNPYGPHNTHNLPAELSSFVGRSAEVETLAHWLAPHAMNSAASEYPGSRHVTLTGPGGIGKTRLALRVARQLANRFPDGVWLVELATVEAGTGVAIVGQVVRRALGIAEPAEGVQAEPVGTVVEALRARRTLLVLDGCEHVVGATADLVSRLLRRAPEVRVLATSREPLDVEGETVVRVDPLPMLGGTGGGGGAPSEAARLFLVRARAASPAFDTGAGDLAAVEDLCRRLDGIPLAIELAAARANVLSIGQILERLQDRFRLLAGAPRGTQARQQTLRMTLDWSWDLLTEPERGLLARLSVFRGSFALDAVEAVATSDSVGDALDVLGQLVKKSLVVSTTATEGEARYALLDTVRAYGADRLGERGDEDKAVAAHAAHFLTLAERAASHLHGPSQAEWLRRLDVEHDDLRAAFDRAVEGGQTELALRVATALWWYWVVRGTFNEGAERLARALALEGGATSPVHDLLRARALVAAAYLGVRALPVRPAEQRAAVAFAHVEPRALEAVALFRRHGDTGGEAHALSMLGNLVASTSVVQRAGDTGWRDRCAHLLESSLPLAREAGDRWLAAYITNCLGVIDRNLGNRERARARIEEALALRREMGDAWGIATSLSDLGQLAVAEGDDAAARARYEESLAIRRGLGDALGLIASTYRLAYVHTTAGEYARARELLDECLPIARRAAPRLAETWVAALQGVVACGERDLEAAQRCLEVALVALRGADARFDMVFALRGAARLAAARGQWRRALRLAGATQAFTQPPTTALPGSPGGMLGPAERTAFERALAPAAAALGPEQTAMMRAEGVGWSLEQSIDYALSEEDCEGVASIAAAEAKNGSRPDTGPLSPREQEVASLVAEGLTNPQIAEQLVISQRTAARHVEHILNKLAFSSRAQIAAWVVRQEGMPA